MKNSSLIALGKTISKASVLLQKGNGSTWPGHIALKFNKNFINDLLQKSGTKTILVVGTNGKTTTSKLIQEILRTDHKKVILNESGANLINGIASTLIDSSSMLGKLKAAYAILEIDENTLPKVLNQVTPDYIVILNLFRDQLDRYGEVNIIAEKWSKALNKLNRSTTLIANADDPLIAYVAEKSSATKIFFGLIDKTLGTKEAQYAADSVYCPNCSSKLTYETVYFSHLGDYYCKKCGFKRPQVNQKNLIYPLPGLYNRYNTLAAVTVAKEAGVNKDTIDTSLQTFSPAFGRQEIIDYKGKSVQLFLSKNPTSFNQSFKTIIDQGAKNLLIILNDRIPDGHDVSWIWDTDLNGIEKLNHIFVTGDRVYDMALRVKYTDHQNYQTFENLEESINKATSVLSDNETLYVLPTYSAMLDVRKILTGKKIL